MPAHAQRMSSLLAADKVFDVCRVAMRGRAVGFEAGGQRRRTHSVQPGRREGAGWRRRRESNGGHTMQGELRGGR